MGFLYVTSSIKSFLHGPLSFAKQLALPILDPGVYDSSSAPSLSMYVWSSAPLSPMASLLQDPLVCL